MPLVTTNQAVKTLFGIERSEPLRSKANSYLRNGVIPSSLVIDKEFSDASMAKRGKKLLKAQGVDCLFNALVLDAFFNDTKYVKEIFEKPKTRELSASLCEEVLLKAQVVTMTCQLSDVSRQFLYQLRDNSFNLRETRLVSPFAAQHLPQMDMALQNMGLLYQLLRAQRLSLSHKEKIILCWLDQDLCTAAELAAQVDDGLLQADTALAEFVKMVQKEYQEAQSFNHLLNFLPD